MREQRELLELYVDESEISLPGGTRLLIYAAIDPHGLAAALPAIEATKMKYGLPADEEMKWNSSGGDAETKARAKEEFLWAVASNSRAIISCTEGADKDTAFLNLLEDIKCLCVEHGLKRVRIVCDEDAFRTMTKVNAAIAAWPPEVICESIRPMPSSAVPPIQFADLTAGSFRYRLACQFGIEAKRITFRDEDRGIEEEWPLDEFFGTMFRWSVWGGTPLEPWDGEGDYKPEHATIDCFGAGIYFHGTFTDEELAAFRQVCLFFRGCMS